MGHRFAEVTRPAAAALVIVFSLGCGPASDTKQLECSAGQIGCNLSCTGSDECVAKCQSTTGDCTLTCKDSSNCTCEGNTCNIACQTSGSCTCRAAICSCS